jgi:hypothetical protein
MRFPIACLPALLILVIGFDPAARADVITEGVLASRCAEAADLKIPKKMEFLQTVMVSAFEAPGRVALLVYGGNDEDGSGQNEGKIIAKVTLIKEDGTELKLGKLKAKTKEGELEAIKIVDASLARGDQLHWLVKTKGLPTLSSDLQDCWQLELFVGVADEILE